MGKVVGTLASGSGNEDGLIIQQYQDQNGQFNERFGSVCCCCCYMSVVSLIMSLIYPLMENQIKQMMVMLFVNKRFFYFPKV